MSPSNLICADQNLINSSRSKEKLQENLIISEQPTESEQHKVIHRYYLFTLVVYVDDIS